MFQTRSLTGESRSCKGRTGKNLGQSPRGPSSAVFDLHAPVAQLGTQSVGLLEVLGFPGFVARRDAGFDPALELGVRGLAGGEDVQDAPGVVQRCQCPLGPRSLPSPPPARLPIQVAISSPDEVEQGGAGPRGVQVVVERRAQLPRVTIGQRAERAAVTLTRRSL